MKTVIIGGPRCGKSTTAATLHTKTGASWFCCDHLSRCKEPDGRALYLPEKVSWYQPGAWVVGNWFNLTGPWIIEGSTLVRALRYWVEEGFGPDAPCDEIILCFKPKMALSPGQSSLLKGVKTIWSQVAPYYHQTSGLSIHS